MLSRQKLGYIFENTVHNLISQTNYKVLREKDIIKKYGIIYYGIDHIINLQEYVICIQDKWRDTKSTLSDVNHFIKTIEKIGDAENKRCIGIYLSKLSITKNAFDAFEYENIKMKHKFISLSNDNMDKLLYELTYLFYSNQIYFYENDGSTIMLYPNNITRTF